MPKETYFDPRTRVWVTKSGEPSIMKKKEGSGIQASIDGIRAAYARQTPAEKRHRYNVDIYPVAVAAAAEKVLNTLIALIEEHQVFEKDGSLARYELQDVNGLTYFADPETPKLEKSEQAVYPYHDEATLLLQLASRLVAERQKPFDLVVDPVAGGGHSGLPIIHRNLAAELVGMDNNPRAINLAQANALTNVLEERSSFIVGDIREGLPEHESKGNTLYIANPPFALKIKDVDMATMRNGGESGLEITKVYIEKALQAAKPGDVIIGLAYSRIHSRGSIEFVSALRKLAKKYGASVVTYELLEGQKLWRGFNGEKEQPNPMPITPQTFAAKANPADSEERKKYEDGARLHRKKGYRELGYYSYVIYK